MFTWQFIQEKLAHGRQVILLYVLQSDGSSPGRQGFHMAVADDGFMSGSIGGGIMEHKFVEMAKAKLRTAGVIAEIYRQVHDKKAPIHQSGMICSGEQTIFLYRVQDKDVPHINRMLQSLQRNENGSLVLSQEGIAFNSTIPINDFDYRHEMQEEFLFIEKTGPKNILHIVGGGHCSLALSRLMRSMDFHIKVYEHRDALNTLNANEYAHEVKIVASYASLDHLIHPGKNVYVVIMTLGYRTDDEALRALLAKNFKYLGVLGSKKKIEKMFDQYRKEKIKQKYLAVVHAPIGISIKSETPAEIAVSIAAEIIRVKNKTK